VPLNGVVSGALRESRIWAQRERRGKSTFFDLFSQRTKRQGTLAKGRCAP
jgi:hypothetical protein